MNAKPQTLSTAARGRILSLPREPLFYADWLNVIMIHLEVEPPALQSVTPFELDLWQGRAFVTLVAFSMRSMRPRFGGWLGRRMFGLLASHEFLNVRTYVRHGDETGIHFLAEWLSSPLASSLGRGYSACRISWARLITETSLSVVVCKEGWWMREPEQSSNITPNCSSALQDLDRALRVHWVSG